MHSEGKLDRWCTVPTEWVVSKHADAPSLSIGISRMRSGWVFSCAKPCGLAWVRVSRSVTFNIRHWSSTISRTLQNKHNQTPSLFRRYSGSSRPPLGHLPKQKSSHAQGSSFNNRSLASQRYGGTNRTCSLTGIRSVSRHGTPSFLSSSYVFFDS